MFVYRFFQSLHRLVERDVGDFGRRAVEVTAAAEILHDELHVHRAVRAGRDLRRSAPAHTREGCAHAVDVDEVVDRLRRDDGYDTILICSVTGLSYACSGVAAKAGEGALFLTSGQAVDPRNPTDLLIAAFETSFGRFGGIFLGGCITLFALATILGWAVQGEAAFTWLFGEKYVGTYRIFYAICPILGAVFSLDLIWMVSDLANGLLALPNLICLWVLAPGICKEILGGLKSPQPD